MVRVRETCQSVLVVLGEVEFFESSELPYEGLVLALQYGHSVLQTAYVLFLLAPTLASCLSVEKT